MKTEQLERYNRNGAGGLVKAYQCQQDQIESLRHQVRELCGVIDEYSSLPCISTFKRMKEACTAASKKLKVTHD